jgi:hypothetical protein
MVRYLSRVWAITVLTALLGSAVMPLFGDLHDADDRIGIQDHAERESHHKVYQFEIVRDAVGDDHCAICYMQRAMGGAADDAKRYVNVSDSTPWSVGMVQSSTRRLVRRTVPPRAPPAHFL